MAVISATEYLTSTTNWYYTPIRKRQKNQAIMTLLQLYIHQPIIYQMYYLVSSNFLGGIILPHILTYTSQTEVVQTKITELVLLNDIIPYLHTTGNPAYHLLPVPYLPVYPTPNMLMTMHISGMKCAQQNSFASIQYHFHMKGE